MPNSWGNNWLGNIVIGAKLGSTERNDNFINCRGCIYDMDRDGNSLTVRTETAWVPMLGMWQKLKDKYLSDDAEMLFWADECGVGITVTNDPSYDGHFIIDSYMEDVDSLDDATCEDIINIARKLNIKKDSIEGVIAEIAERDLDLWIRPWEIAEIQDYL